MGVTALLALKVVKLVTGKA